jgi:hypothetical protein
LSRDNTPDLYVCALVAIMGINYFMEMMRKLHGVKPNKDMVAFLEMMTKEA